MPTHAPSESTRTTSPTLQLATRSLQASLIATATFACIASILASCSSPPPRAAIEVLADRRESALARMEALQSVEHEAAANPAVADTLNQTLAEILWSPAQPRALRRDALQRLTKSDASLAQLKNDGPRLLVREADPVIIADLCEVAASHNWKEWTPSLIRVCARTGGNLSTDVPGLSEHDKKLITSRDWTYSRSAENAITSLEAGTDLNTVLWKYIINQPDKLDEGSIVRRDAYTILSRRDPSGDLRRTLIAQAAPESKDGKIVIEALKAGLADLRVLPDQGEELRWLLDLAKRDSDAAREYWNEVSAAIKSIPSDQVIQLRHIEALRWSHKAHSDWLAMDRSTLAQRTNALLASRTHQTRSWGSRGINQRPYNEFAATDNASAEANRYSALSWPDFIVILMLDEVLNNQQTASRLIQQASLDNSDRTSEYGGLIISINNASPTPILYPPRAKDKRGDLEFHAPDDMIRDQTRALAHYHFHATIDKNQEAAGPSIEDMQYANSWARGCVVFTSVGKDRLNADYYQPGTSIDSAGVVLDLGILTTSGFEPAR